MAVDTATYSFADLLSNIVDNRGKTCPVTEDGLPLIATNCVKNETLFPVFEKVRYVDQETYDSWFRGHPEPGDIIFVTKGSPGNVCWTPDPVNFCIAQDMVAIRAKHNIVDSKYLFALLRSPTTQAQILNMHVGTMIPHFKKGDFKNLYFEIPNDLGLQRAIGDIYFSFCEKIELNRQMNATLEAMAQALFKSWFVDFDPVIDNALAAGNSIPESLQARAKARAVLGDKRKPLPNAIQELFPDSFVFNEDMGWVPEGWEPVSMTSMVESISDTYPLNTVEQVIFLNTGDILEGDFLHSNYSEVSGLPGQAKKSIKKGDILYSEIRPKNKRFAFVDFESKDHVVSTKLMVLRSKDPFTPLFPYFVLKQSRTINLLQHLAESRSGTFPQITYQQLEQVKIMMPKNNWLIDFFESTVLEDNHTKSLRLNMETKTLTKLRDTLLPKLLSGQLCIPEAEKQIAEAI